MKVTASNQQMEAASSWYQTVRPEQTEEKEAQEDRTLQPDMDGLSRTLPSVSGQESKDSQGMRIKSSAPDDSVGQLAALLARAETKIDVQQVSSKAMRALVNLQMSLSTCEGTEKAKIGRMVRRMKKLIKRIQKKLRHLSKEEQLENQRRLAEKKGNAPEEAKLQDELSVRRKKRRREEKNYAQREIIEDIKEAARETNPSTSGLGAASPSAPDLSALADLGGSATADLAGASFDVTV